MPRVCNFNSSKWIRTGAMRRPDVGEYCVYHGEVYRRDDYEEGWTSYEIVVPVGVASVALPDGYEPSVQQYEEPKGGFVSTPYLTQYET